MTTMLITGGAATTAVTAREQDASGQDGDGGQSFAAVLDGSAGAAVPATGTTTGQPLTDAGADDQAALVGDQAAKSATETPTNPIGAEDATSEDTAATADPMLSPAGSALVALLRSVAGPTTGNGATIDDTETATSAATDTAAYTTATDTAGTDTAGTDTAALDTAALDTAAIAGPDSGIGSPTDGPGKSSTATDPTAGAQVPSAADLLAALSQAGLLSQPAVATAAAPVQTALAQTRPVQSDVSAADVVQQPNAAPETQPLAVPTPVGEAAVASNPASGVAGNSEGGAATGSANPGKADPVNADPGKADPVNVDPGKADPSMRVATGAAVPVTASMAAAAPTPIAGPIATNPAIDVSSAPTDLATGPTVPARSTPDTTGSGSTAAGPNGASGAPQPAQASTSVPVIDPALAAAITAVTSTVSPTHRADARSRSGAADTSDALVGAAAVTALNSAGTDTAALSAGAAAAAAVNASLTAAANTPAPAAAAPTGSTVPAELPQQLATPLLKLTASGDGVHRIVVQLHPADLGSVSVEVRMRSGEISVALSSANGDARASMNAALPALHQHLTDAGLTDVKLTVDSSSTGSSGFFGTTGGGATGGQQGQERYQTARMPNTSALVADSVNTGDGTNAVRSRQPSTSGVDRWL
jgi:flagellar hook-length control protein FliK